MRRKTLIILASAFGLAAPGVAVAGPTISTQAAPGVNFSSYKTYNWIEADVPPGGNPITYQQIMADIDSALASKGYSKVQANGDLGLILTIGEQQKTDVQTWGRWGLQTSVYQYTQGQLSLDVFDLKTKQAVWHGQASETINPDKPNQSKVDAALAKFMTGFPATAATAP